MPLFVEGIVPQLMSAPLLAFVNNYQAANAIQPRVVHDFAASRGKQVHIDRFKPWGERGLSLLARVRDKQQIIGTQNSEGLSKSTRIVQLDEFTGPSTITGEPSTLHISYEDMVYARNRLWDYGLMAFHESIGSMNLADDYARWNDRSMVERLMQCQFKFNPGDKSDNNVQATDKISRSDLLVTKERLAFFNTPRFPDGTYHYLISERQFRHLQEDPDFVKYAIATVQGGSLPPMNAYPAYGPSGQPMVASGLGPRMMQQPLAPVVFEGFTFYPTNNLPTRLITTSNGPRIAHLGFAFGPDSVGIGSGGRGPQVKLNNNTDFERHFHFIWQWYGQYVYMLDDDEASGICVEVRTYAA